MTFIEISSFNQTITVETEAVLECIGDGGPNNTYQWQANSSDLIAGTSPVLTLTNVHASDGGEYTCVVSNAAGNDSASTFLYVFPYFILQPTDMQTSSGMNVTFVCEAEAFPSPEYDWERVDGGPIREEIATNTSLLVFAPVMYGDEGGYYCNVSSLDRTIRSQDVTLTGTGVVMTGM